MPQDVEGEAYDYPDYFLKKRVWYIDRRSPVQREIEAAVSAIMRSEKPLLIVGGGVTYSEAWETAQFFAEKLPKLRRVRAISAGIIRSTWAASA